MKEVLGPLFARRSIRNYKDRDVPQDLVREVLEAAMAAPSACAMDPWEFIVVRQPDILERLADVLPHGQMLRGAAVGLVVCGDLDRAHDNQESYLLQDCSAAIQNALLSADMLGLGAVWLGVHPRPERMSGLREIFSLPESIVPISVISLGWPDEEKEARTRYRDDAVHSETW